MAARVDLLELVWPLAPGGVLLFTGGLVTYALRGPVLVLPSSPAGAVATLVGAIVLGHLSRLAASGIAWGVHAVWAVDLFLESPASELLDEGSPRRLSPALLDRLNAVLEARFGLKVEAISEKDTDEARKAKLRGIDEAIALARAGVVAEPGSGTALAWLEARADAARALCAALGLGAVAALFVAAHDRLFARSVAHALSELTLVVLGLTLLVAAVAALRRARAGSRRLTLEALLSLLGAAGTRATGPA